MSVSMESLLRLAKEMGVDVHEGPAPPGLGAACLIVPGRISLIWVDERLPLPERRWAVAHELGHFATGGLLADPGSRSLAEARADRWAARTLMPERVLAPLLLEGLSLMEIADSLAVPERAVRMRLQILDWTAHPPDSAGSAFEC